MVRTAILFAAAEAGAGSLGIDGEVRESATAVVGGMQREGMQERLEFADLVAGSLLAEAVEADLVAGSVVEDLMSVVGEAHNHNCRSSRALESGIRGAQVGQAEDGDSRSAAVVAADQTADSFEPAEVVDHSLTAQAH